jgi:hypothetical protein
MKHDAKIDTPRREGSRKMNRGMMSLKKAVCVVVLACMLAGFGIPWLAPTGIQPAQAQFGEVWLAIQVAFGAIKFTKDMFSLAKYFLGPNPTKEAMELLEQQEEQLIAIIDEEAQISEEISAITSKLEFNNLTQEANKQIAAITDFYAQMQEMAQNGYDYYQGNQAPLAQFALDVIRPLNSMETAVEAFYQSLVVHPPGSPNCALQQARDIALDELNGSSPASDFSTLVESTNGVGIIAERPMYFAFNGAWDGGSCQSGMDEPETAYYFAEGTVRPDFHSYICIQNPAYENAAVRITYMKGDGTTTEQDVFLTARSRTTVNVNGFFGMVDGPAADFSAKVESTNGVGIVAERPMYFKYKGAWAGGHVSVGATSPSTMHYLAEGTTRPGFDSYLCIQNPEDREAEVLITYMKGDGSNQQQALAVPPRTRTTVKVNDVIGQYDSNACDFSAKIESVGGVGLVVERPVYFGYKGSWNGGHCQGGAPEAFPTQYFAEGTTRPGFDSYLCIQNPGGTAADVTITYMKGDGSNATQTLSIAPSSRYTVAVKDQLGEANDEAHDFSAKVECTNGQQIVAERSIYFDYEGKWNGGHCQSGMAEPSSRHYFAEGTRRPGFTTYLCIQNPEDREAEVRVTYLKGDGKSQVQELKVPARSRTTINCSQAVEGTSLLSAYEDNLETLFKNSWIYQLMAAECVCFARDYDPVTYGSSDDYRTEFYDRYMKNETEMFLACTEQLVMSQVDVSGLARSQKGIYNLPADAKEVLTRADMLAQIALGEGVPVTNADGVVTNLNLGLSGRMVASRDIVPAGSTPPALRARVHGGSTTYGASVTELIPLPWISQEHALLSYDCWTGAAPYNTLTLDNMWSVVRYRFDNLPKGTYDILDAGGNVVSTGTVSEQSGTNPDDPTETYKVTFGEFDTVANTRGGPAILLDSSRWSSSSTHSGALREMDDPNHYHSVIDPKTGGLGLWLYATGGSHYTNYTYDQENRLERTITAGADMDICPHYNFVPKVCLTDVNGQHYSDPHGFVQGDITILPSHYTITASYELGVTDLSTNVYTKLLSDSVTCSEDLTHYDVKKSFGYDSKPGTNTYHMIAGHQYKFTFKLNGHHYLNTQDNSNMWAILNQLVLLDGMRILGF